MNAQMINNCRTGLKLTHKAIAEAVYRDPNKASRVKTLELGGDRILMVEAEGLRKFFGAMFLKLRQSQGLSQAAVAAKVSLHPSTVADWEQRFQNG